MAPVTTVLITGANVGLGFECARQLASKQGIKKVILGCRNQAKAEAAKKDLEEQTKKNDNFYEILLIDVSDLAKVRQAVDELKEPIDGLVLNAGGVGGSDPAEMTEYGVPAIVAANLLGHVLLVDLLMEQKKLTGSVVYSGTEAARGVALMGMKQPQVESGSVEEFTSICDGSFFKSDKSFEVMYGYTKLVAALWMSSMARKYPSVRFVTMSPGATSGTTFARDMPRFKQFMFMHVLIPIMSLMGKFHTLEVGGKRYVDALMDDQDYKTGVFYASSEGVTADVVDQVKYMDIFHNETMQDNANAAIHKFIK